MTTALRVVLWVVAVLFVLAVAMTVLALSITG